MSEFDESTGSNSSDSDPKAAAGKPAGANGGMNFDFLNDLPGAGPAPSEVVEASESPGDQPDCSFEFEAEEPAADAAVSATPDVGEATTAFNPDAEALGGDAWTSDTPEFGASSDGTPADLVDVDPNVASNSTTANAAASESVPLAADALVVAAAAAQAMATPPVPEVVDDPLPEPLPETDSAYEPYRALTAHVRQTSLLAGIEAALGWDERCMMPAAGAENRAEQMTLLSGMVHERLTDPRLGEYLEQLAGTSAEQDENGEASATIRQIRRQYEKRLKLPKSLVEELTHTAVMGQHTWQEAREKNDFSLFAPLLEKMVRLKRQQAEALGYAEVPYDALLDEFEQGELTSRVTAVLGALRDDLIPLVMRTLEGRRTNDVEILHRRYPIDVQRNFGRFCADRIGFDFQRGRLDVTAHPFCSGLGPNDCRITTRYDERYLNSGLFGILHEAGHGIYDQGLRSDQYGLPLGEAVSMGIHESQSRMWEIFVGRSLPFWKHFYPAARSAFPEALGGVPLGRFYTAVNDVRPTLIRVEADEFFYNLHILIRFELEQALIAGDLNVADLPGAWNEKYRNYLSVEVPNDADGVLQDIHWSAGLFGYFPTYTLGNLYAAQFYEQADRDLGGLDAQFERGEFQHLRNWLRSKIHVHGQRYTAAELCRRITGRELSHEPLIAHLRRKYELLYDPAAPSIAELDVADSPATAALTGAATQAAGVAVGSDVGGFGFAADAGLGNMVGGGAPIVTRTVRRPKASPAGTIIVFAGIVLGGILGITLGLWILLWWRGPQGDVLGIRDKLPTWLVPEWKEPEPEIPVDEQAAPTGEPTSLLRPAHREAYRRLVAARRGEATGDRNHATHGRA